MMTPEELAQAAKDDYLARIRLFARVRQLEDALEKIAAETKDDPFLDAIHKVALVALKPEDFPASPQRSA